MNEHQTITDIAWDDLIDRLEDGENSEDLAQELGTDPEWFYNFCIELQALKEESCEGN